MTDDKKGDEEKSRRRIIVPGRSIEATIVVRDLAANMVLAIPINGEVVVVFVSPKPTSMVMSVEQAQKFTKEIRDAYQSFRDEAVLKQMEKEFDSE